VEAKEYTPTDGDFITALEAYLRMVVSVVCRATAGEK
jgi:hypothetical protein